MKFVMGHYYKHSTLLLQLSTKHSQSVMKVCMKKILIEY